MLWDWNGTLLDDVVISMETMNHLLKRRNMKTIESLEAYRAIFGFPVIDYYRQLGFDFKKESFESISVEFIALYTQLSKHCSLMEGARELLEDLRKQHIHHVIVSASQQADLLRQVQQFQCEELFDDIIGISDIYAASKIERAKQWIQNSLHRFDELFFVGDSLHDKEVADALQCRCFLIAQGHQNYDRLKQSGAVVLPNLQACKAMLL